MPATGGQGACLPQVQFRVVSSIIMMTADPAIKTNSAGRNAVSASPGATRQMPTANRVAVRLAQAP